MASLSTIFASLQKGFLKNVLTGAGLTLATSGIVLTTLNTVITTFKNSLGSISITILQLASICGFDVAFSLVLGAIATKYMQNSGKLFLKKATN